MIKTEIGEIKTFLPSDLDVEVKGQIRSPNEPLYVISYRPLIHMEALSVIFGQIQGDYINFTMAAVAAMLIFLAGSKINHHIGLPTV